MDANTVQEIANQLGIGVDQILQYLPAYAQAQIMGWIIPIVAGIVFFIISLIVFIKSYTSWNKYNDLYMKELEKDLESMYKKKTNFYLIMCFIFGGIGVIILSGLLLAIPSSIEPLIGWSTSPELMLLKSLIPN